MEVSRVKNAEDQLTNLSSVIVAKLFSALNVFVLPLNVPFVTKFVSSELPAFSLLFTKILWLNANSGVVLNFPFLQ